MIRKILIVTAVIIIMALIKAVTPGKVLSPGEVERIVDAPSLISYSASGTTTSIYRGKPLSLKVNVIHGKPNKNRIEYLTEPLKGVVVIDDGKQTWRCDPKLHSTVSMESGQGLELGLFLKNHRVEQVGSEKIAGRPTSVLLVKTTSGQVKKRLWVDATTSVILRWEDYDARGKVHSSTRFDSIKYTNNTSSYKQLLSSSSSAFARPSGIRCLEGPGKAMSRQDLSKAVGFAVKTPSYVPKGYRPDGYRLYDCPCGCGHESAYIRYTNGLESISVFETRADSGCMKSGKCDARMGKCLVRNQLALTTKDGVTFVVLGDLKARTLRRVTESIR